MTKYLTLNQVLHIAEEVTGVSLETLARVSQEALAIWIKKTLRARNGT